MKKHALAVAAALVFATAAGAQQTQGSKPQTMEAVVTVTKVDPLKRTVEVETPKGRTVVAVPDDTKLEDIQVGSRYRVRYSEPVAVAIVRGAQQSSATEPASAAVGQTGKGTGEGVRKDTMAGIVDQLDPAGNQIVVRTFEGGKHGFRIADGAAQGLQGIKNGDAVTVTYLQAVATQLRSTPQPVSDPAPAP